MDKKNYFNSVTDQVMALPQIADILTESCFDAENLKQTLPPEIARKIRRVIIVGCGDSYSACGAMLPGFRKLSGVRKCDAPDIMDFLCYYTDVDIKKQFSFDEVLLIGISFSGSSMRVVQSFEKANALGVETLIITQNPASAGGQAAKHVFNVQTPKGCNSPGLRSYYASLVGLAALGAHVGVCSGFISEQRFAQVKESICTYTKTFMEDFEAIDDMMFAEALRMKDLTKFEVIADGNEGYSAQFVEEKFIECGSVYCDHTNSEEFAHISVFFRGPQEVGTVVMVNEADPSLGRMKDTIAGCLAQHRPTVIVTDAAPETFAIVQKDLESAPNMYNIAKAGVNAMETAGTPTVCRIAKAPEQWMSPLVDFVPGSLLAGYQAAVNEKMFFGGRFNFRTQTWNMG